MDLLEKLDNLLNKDNRNSNLNVNFLNNINQNNNVDDSNIAEKEDDAKLVKDFDYCNVDFEAEHDNDEFQDCFVLSDDEDNDDDYDFLSSDDSTEDEDNTNSESIEKFLNDCKKITTDHSDEEKLFDENIQNELLQKLSGTQNSVMFDKIEENKSDNNEQYVKPEIDNGGKTELSQLFPEKIIDFYDPDFESLELRINQLWKQIDKIQEQIKEEKAYSIKEAKEIKEFMSKNNKKIKEKSLLDNTSSYKSNFPIDEEITIKNEEKTNDKTVESKGTNTFISAQTEARVHAKKELLQKMNMINTDSEANMFKRKLKEVEELCALEMNKVVNIISELYSLEDAKDITHYEYGPQKFSGKLNFYSNPVRNKSNMSLPDATKLKNLANLVNNNVINEFDKGLNLTNTMPAI